MLYPLRFKPIFREYIWGGRRLQSTLNKPIGDGDCYAECWEVVDRADDQSVVANGELRGHTLRDIMDRYGDVVMGMYHEADAFPLLFKFLDCNRNLSVQVHPDDARGALLDPPDLGKTEAWVVLANEPGSKIYAGLCPGVDRDALANAIANGETESCLNSFEPEVGDCIFIPAGVVHALGEGLVIAEIQQASDTTYRLFDWNRVDENGKSRQLHIAEALEAIDYEAGTIAPRQPVTTEEPWRERLVECDKFVLDRIQLSQGQQVTVASDDRMHLLAVLAGQIDNNRDVDDRPYACGDTALMPAALPPTNLTATEDAWVLDIWLP